MRNKILIVSANVEIQSQFEQIFQKIIQQGGELFFANKREDGISILNKELPQLVFLDSLFVGERNEWIKKDVHLLFMCEKQETSFEGKDVVLKPINGHQVLEKSQSVLNKDPVLPIPPM